MKFHGKNVLPRAALTAALTMSLGLSQSVLAAEGSGDMDVNAGLTQALTVSCTALNFGTTSIVAGDRGGSTVVTLAATNGELTSTGSAAFALDNDSTATRGKCTISGSGTTTGTFTAEVQTPDPLGGDSGGTAPSTALDLTVDTFTTDGGLVDGNDGTGTINIGGDLTIPDDLVSENMGDYTGTVTVTVTDPE